MIRSFLLSCLFLFIFGILSAGERFWVGGSGNWNDSKHWSLSSGGLAGAAIPISSDDVIFDSKSFLTNLDVVLIDANARCKDFIWEDKLKKGKLSGNSNTSLNIFGSLLLSSFTDYDFKGSVNFKATTLGNSIRTSNHVFLNAVYFDGENGKWKLLDNLNTQGDLYILSGVLNCNRQAVQCNSVIRNESHAGLLFDFSNITTNEGWKLSDSPNSKLSQVSLNTINAHSANPITAATNTVQCINGTYTITLDLSSINLTCNGNGSGSASVTVTGGVGPYTYSWQPSGQSTVVATGLNAGTHTLELYDNAGNFCSGSISISEPGVLSLNITSTVPSASCNGLCDALAKVNCSGGTGVYTYAWSTSPVQTTQTATSLCAKTYTVLVSDANNCTRSKTITITQPPILVANGSSANIDCYNNCNGNACVAPAGGNPPYTYAWSPTINNTPCISNLCPTPSLTCVVTDTKSCVVTYTTSITQPTQLTAAINSTNLLCNGICTGSATVTASGGTGTYTYSWSPGGYSTSAITGLCANTYSCTIRDVNNCSITKAVTITQPTSLTANPTSTDVTCFSKCDGTVSANASGGTGAYTYLWSPGGYSTSSCSNLCNGIYTVSITDNNNCSISRTVTVTQPALLTTTVTKTDITCNGLCDGIVTATTTGGNPPYTYTWNPGSASTSSVTGLCAGTYSVLVKDTKGCTIPGSTTIAAPAALTLSISTTPTSCSGKCDGTATPILSGGTQPYTYSWNLGMTTSTLTGLCAGSYTLTLTDARGCFIVRSGTVTQPSAVNASITTTSPNPLNCNGDCNGVAIVTVTGGTGAYTYSWSPIGETTSAVSNLCAGTYSVAVSDSKGCTSSATITFTQPTSLTANLTKVDPTCNGVCTGSITATVGGGNGGYIYSWTPGGQTTASITNQCAGNYTFTVRDAKACTASRTVTLTAPPLLNANPTIVKEISCFGQCDGALTSNPTGGQPPYTYLWTGAKSMSTISGLCAATYTLRVTDNLGCFDNTSIVLSQPVTLSSSLSSSTSSCNSCNGTATVSTFGGTKPYTYSWAPGGYSTSAVTGLCIGNYSVTVKDANGCTNSLVVPITPIVTITVTVSGTNVSCNGSCDGIATANASGGVAPYTYSWMPTVQTTSTATGLCAGSYTVSVADFNGCTSTSTVSFSNPPPLTTTMTGTPASCGLCNGKASILVGGGTGPYTYKWSGFPTQTTAIATGLCTGNYTVTVTDSHNCIIKDQVSIVSAPPLSPNPTVIDATCSTSNGSICLSPSGGVPGYTYSWLPGGATTSCLTGIPAGIYTVSLSDASSCTVILTNPVSNSTTMSVTSNTIINPSCATRCDGYIDFNVTGGTGPYTYEWFPGGQTSTSASGLCAGQYIIKVTDNVPCTKFLTVNLIDPNPLVMNPSVTDVACNGGSDGKVCLAPSGGSGTYTVSWSDGQTGICATGFSVGTYSVILTDGYGCTNSLSVAVTEPTPINISFTSTNVKCYGNCNGTAVATVSGGSPNYTYSWSNGASLPTIVNLCADTYTLSVRDSHSCLVTSSVTITQPTPLTTSTSVTNISCNTFCDGTAVVQAAGGTTPYTYYWVPVVQSTSSISALCVGSYTSTVTDNKGCSSTNTISITQPAAISISVTPTNTTCFGGCDGSAIAIINGGTGAYTYSWTSVGQTTSAATGLCVGSHTLQITDANRCLGTQTFTITSPAALQANISTIPPSCSGTGCDGEATSSPMGGVGPYTYAWNPGNQTISTATGLCIGNYTLTLSDQNACSITTTVNVTLPTPVINSWTVSAATCGKCDGTIDVTTTGGTGSYTYSWVSGQSSSSITGLCANIYIVHVTDAKGCMATDTITVNNITGPAISASGNNLKCFGVCNATATVTVTPPGNGPPWNYLWTPTNQTTSVATGLCVGQHIIKVTDTLGCISFDTVLIQEPLEIKLNPAVTNATCFGICNGSASMTVTGGTGVYSYLWNPGGETTSSVTGMCAGDYTFTVWDANSCSQTTTSSVGQNTVISSTVTTTNLLCNSVCNGDASVVAVTGGSAPYTYAWDNGETSTSISSLCAGNYTVTITDKIGCKDTTHITISEPTAITPTFTVQNLLCNTRCNGSISANVSGGTGSYIFLWSPGGETTSSVTGLCAGNYTLTISDSNTCSITKTFLITEPDLISATSTVTNTSCNNTSDGVIVISPSGGIGLYTYYWSPYGQTIKDITGLHVGTYSVLITDANGCSFTDSMKVVPITTVIADAGKDTSFCLGGTVSLCSRSINATSVEWYQIQSPAWIFLGNTDCTTSIPPTGNSVFAIIASNGNCSDTDSVVVMVYPPPVLVLSNDTAICGKDSSILCASGAFSYQWFLLPDWSTPITSSSCIKVSPALGITSYGVIGYNGTCFIRDSVKVTVMPIPYADAGKDTIICSGHSAKLCSRSMVGTIQKWYSLPAWTAIDTTSCILVSPAVGINLYALEVSNGICRDIDTVSVIVNPTPDVDAGENVTIVYKESTVLSGKGIGTYSWTPTTGLSDPAIPNPVASPTTTTTYTLIVTDPSGCYGIDSVRITVLQVVTPNDGISPNGDGKNDVWVIPGVEAFPQCVVEVYNRWGELLFRSVGYKDKWDGTYKGKQLPVGSYYYIINLNSTRFPEPITGPITIMR